MHHFRHLEHSKDQMNTLIKERGRRERKERKKANEERERKGVRVGGKGNVSNRCDLRHVIHCYSHDFG